MISPNKQFINVFTEKSIFDWNAHAFILDGRAIALSEILGVLRQCFETRSDASYLDMLRFCEKLEPVVSELSARCQATAVSILGLGKRKRSDDAILVGLHDKIEAIKQKCNQPLADARELLQQAESQITKPGTVQSFEQWVTACELLDLTDTHTRLNVIFATSHTLAQAQSRYLELSTWRNQQLSGSVLSYAQNPESKGNVLMQKIACLLFQVQSRGELLQRIFPQVRYTYLLEQRERFRIVRAKLSDDTADVELEGVADTLRGVIVFQDVALCQDSYLAMAGIYCSKRRLDPQFWTSMQHNTIGLCEHLFEVVQPLANLRSNRLASTHSPCLEDMIKALADGFYRGSSAGLGTTEVASYEATFALWHFEKDWALFASIYQSAIGVKLSAIIQDVKKDWKNVKGCVNGASQSIYKLLREAKDANDPHLRETRQRDVQNSDDMTALPLTAQTTQLPVAIALRCRPKYDQTDDLILALLEMPTSAYGLILQGLSVAELCEVSDQAAESILPPMQKQAFSAAYLEAWRLHIQDPAFLDTLTEGSGRSLRSLCKNSKSGLVLVFQHFAGEPQKLLRLALQPVDSLTLFHAAAMLNAEAFMILFQCLNTHYTVELRKLLAKVSAGGTNILLNALVGGKEVTELVIEACGYDANLLPLFVNFNSRRAGNILHKAFRRGQLDALAVFLSHMQKPAYKSRLSDMLEETDENGDTPAHIVARLEARRMHLILAAFDGNTKLMDSTLLTRNNRRFNVFEIAACHSAGATEQLLLAYATRPAVLEEFLMARTSSGLSPIYGAAMYNARCFKLILQHFKSQPQHLGKLLGVVEFLRHSPVAFFLFYCNSVDLDADTLALLKPWLFADELVDGVSLLSSLVEKNVAALKKILEVFLEEGPMLIRQLARSDEPICTFHRLIQKGVDTFESVLEIFGPDMGQVAKDAAFATVTHNRLSVVSAAVASGKPEILSFVLAYFANRRDQLEELFRLESVHEAIAPIYTVLGHGHCLDLLLDQVFVNPTDRERVFGFQSSQGRTIFDMWNILNSARLSRLASDFSAELIYKLLSKRTNPEIAPAIFTLVRQESSLWKVVREKLTNSQWLTLLMLRNSNFENPLHHVAKHTPKDLKSLLQGFAPLTQFKLLEAADSNGVSPLMHAANADAVFLSEYLGDLMGATTS